MSFRAVVLLALAVLTLGSVGARFLIRELRVAEAAPELGLSSAAAAGTATGGSALASAPPQAGPDAAGEAAGEPRAAMERALPYLSEGGCLGIAGFLLGLASKKVLKLFLFLAIGAFALVKGLGYGGIVSVDWAQAWQLAQDLVLNVKASAPLGELVQNHLPSAGAFVGGLAVGFKSG